MKGSPQRLVAAVTGVLFMACFFVVMVGFGSKAEAASGPSDASMEPFGIAVSPGVYLVNFMLLYFINPEVGANMPAYRAAIPQEVYECLSNNADTYDCVYADLEEYFDRQAVEIGGSRNKTTFWPSTCQLDPKWQTLVLPEYRQPDQLHQPLGRKRADQLARSLGIDGDMILSPVQYECVMWGPDPEDPENDPDEFGRDIIRACLDDLTNSKGNADIPLSSYGLSLDEQGKNVRSNCAPGAPCLEFNSLATDGDPDEGKLSSLTSIALQCGFFQQLLRLFDPDQTPFIELSDGGTACQQEWGPVGQVYPACIVETTNPGKGR